ncbi:MAG TPA: stage III sporulation protein AC [Eubacteriales bacterium]|nr:stage III sporulation protein AC [Clostridia bacterium]HRV72577.1 stage III sporulation protein AC [Eubacteriales bacterium]
MEITALFKIAGIGLLTAIVVQVLKQNGRDELATVAAVAGLIVGMVMILNMLSQLMDSVRQIFQLY